MFACGAPAGPDLATRVMPFIGETQLKGSSVGPALHQTDANSTAAARALSILGQPPPALPKKKMVQVRAALPLRRSPNISYMYVGGPTFHVPCYVYYRSICFRCMLQVRCCPHLL